MANKPGKPNIQRSVGITGTAADPTIEQEDTNTGTHTGTDPKASSGHGGKVENDFNQMGDQKPTQQQRRPAHGQQPQRPGVACGRQQPVAVAPGYDRALRHWRPEAWRTRLSAAILNILEPS